MRLVNKEPDTNKRKKLILGIIESSHGNQDEANMSMINSLISELKQSNGFYAYCAEYWDIHIKSEKGEFLFDELAKIRRSIIKYDELDILPLQRSLVMRTFTDEIRLRHILGHEDNFALYKKYNDFLSTCSRKRKEYFSSLYTQANHIHYVILLDAILSQNEFEDVGELVREADFYYDKALATDYNDEKSKRATRIKQLDLKMMYHDFNYEETLCQINAFRIHSEINKVGVHVAFCETLLIKAHILNPNNITNELGVRFSKEEIKEIKTHYTSAKKIFKEYKNKYGVFRLNFIMGLFNLILSSRETEERNLITLEELLKNHTTYEKEQNVIRSLLDKKADNTLIKFSILSIIRAYPIILQ